MSTETTTVTIGEATTVTVSANTGPRGPSGSSSGVSDGDKGDITVSASGTVWTIDAGAVTAAKVAADVATQAELDAHAAVTTTHGISAFGATLVDDANAAAARTTLGLGTAATSATGDFATAAQGATADTALQPAAIGTTVQAYDADLGTLAGLETATSGVIATDGIGWVRKTYAQLKTALGLVKADVGLGNVDNTSDASKPVSTATQTALDLKAPLASPALTGTPTAPTATAGTNTTQVATTAFVATATGAYLPQSTFDANSLVKADADNTPVVLPVAASTVVGRKAAGGIDDLTTAELAALFGTPDGTKFLADDGTLKTPSGGGTALASWSSLLVSGCYSRVNPWRGGAFSSVALSTGTVYYQPFWISRSLTLNRIGVQVTTAQAGSTPRLGIYAATDDAPGSLVLDAGTVDASTTGNKEITISQALTPGLYFICVAGQGTAGAQVYGTVNGGTSSGSGWFGGPATSTSFLMDYGSQVVTGTGVSGALPSTAAVSYAAPNANAQPNMFVKVA